MHCVHPVCCVTGELELPILQERPALVVVSRMAIIPIIESIVIFDCKFIGVKMPLKCVIKDIRKTPLLVPRVDSFSNTDIFVF